MLNDTGKTLPRLDCDVFGQLSQQLVEAFATATASLLRDCPVGSDRSTKTERGGLLALVAILPPRLSVVPALTLPRVRPMGKRADRKKKKKKKKPTRSFPTMRAINSACIDGHVMHSASNGVWKRRAGAEPFHGSLFQKLFTNRSARQGCQIKKKVHKAVRVKNKVLCSISYSRRATRADHSGSLQSTTRLAASQ